MLELFLFIVGVTIIFLIINTKPIFKIKEYKMQKEKILIEDTLKYLFDGEYNSYICSIISISKNLAIDINKTKSLINKLKELKLINIDGDGVFLTDAGRDYALKIIRVHRLLESYFAEKTGFNETLWHKLAEDKEHGIEIEKANRISVELGNPMYDPHGDPIPTEKGEIYLQKRIRLDELKEGDYAVILHIEDEPKEIFSILSSYKIYPDMKLKVVKKSDDKIIIEILEKTITLSLNEAKNISVKLIDEKDYLKDILKPLTTLKQNQIAVISSISKAIRGEQRRRLLDLGIVPGSKIKPVLESIGKDPVAYEVRGTLIALRKNQAQHIFIKEVS